MSPRARKLASLLILGPYLALYLGAAAYLGAHVPPHWYFQAPYFALAGVLWAFPAMALLKWADGRQSRPETARPDRRETPS